MMWQLSWWADNWLGFDSVDLDRPSSAATLLRHDALQGVQLILTSYPLLNILQSVKANVATNWLSHFTRLPIHSIWKCFHRSPTESIVLKEPCLKVLISISDDSSTYSFNVRTLLAVSNKLEVNVMPMSCIIYPARENLFLTRRIAEKWYASWSNRRPNQWGNSN